MAQEAFCQGFDGLNPLYALGHLRAVKIASHSQNVLAPQGKEVLRMAQNRFHAALPGRRKEFPIEIQSYQAAPAADFPELVIG